MSAIGQDPVEPTGEVETQDAGTPAAEAAAEPNVTELLGGFGGTLEEFSRRLDTITERLPEPAPIEDEDDDSAPTINFSDDDFNDDGSLTLEAQTREIERIAAAVVDRTLAPQREAEEQARRDTGFDRLEETYTDLKDEATQDRLLELAQQQAQKLGRPELAAEPDFVETVYLANVARTRAGNEVPAGSERGVQLERGGTAPPAAAQSPAPTAGDRIVAAAQKSRFRLS